MRWSFLLIGRIEGGATCGVNLQAHSIERQRYWELLEIRICGFSIIFDELTGNSPNSLFADFRRRVMYRTFCFDHVAE